MTPLQLSRLVADAAAEKKARDIERIDIRERTTMADYFVICEGDTTLPCGGVCRWVVGGAGLLVGDRPRVLARRARLLRPRDPVAIARYAGSPLAAFGQRAGAGDDL